jgi:hypothetical protein
MASNNTHKEVNASRSLPPSYGSYVPSALNHFNAVVSRKHALRSGRVKVPRRTGVSRYTVFLPERLSFAVSVNFCNDDFVSRM